MESHGQKYIIEFQEIPYYLNAMEFGVEMDGTQDFFQMFWPVVVSHKIDDKAPLLRYCLLLITLHTYNKTNEA